MLSSCFTLFGGVTSSPCQLLCAVTSFLQSVVKIQHDLLPGFSRKFFLQFPSTTTFAIILIFRQNTPTIFFIQHHFIFHIFCCLEWCYCFYGNYAGSYRPTSNFSPTLHYITYKFIMHHTCQFASQSGALKLVGN